MAEVEHFMHQVVGDLGAGLSAVLIHIGDRLGLYRAMGDSSPLTSTELAARTGLAERYVREWLHNQAAAGWVTYDPESEAFTLPAEHALLVADDTAPTFLLGGFDFVASAWADEDTITNAFRTGEGIGWHQHDHRLFTGTERFFRPGYQANLVESWLPALDGVVERLQAGAKVADVGCGYGAATVLIGEAFPQSTIVGFDYHDGSIETARARADGRRRRRPRHVRRRRGQGLHRHLRPRLPVRLPARHGRPRRRGPPRARAPRPAGTLLLVEPAAADRPEDNHHPLGRLMYAASTMICTPASLAQEVGLGLGNQVGFERLREILEQAGFRDVRLATTTPVNLVIEARPDDRPTVGGLNRARRQTRSIMASHPAGGASSRQYCSGVGASRRDHSPQSASSARTWDGYSATAARLASSDRSTGMATGVGQTAALNSVATRQASCPGMWL